MNTDKVEQWDGCTEVTAGEWGFVAVHVDNFLVTVKRDGSNRIMLSIANNGLPFHLSRLESDEYDTLNIYLQGK